MQVGNGERGHHVSIETANRIADVRDTRRHRARVDFIAPFADILQHRLELRAGYAPGLWREPQYRLRVGSVRVFYDVDGATVVVLAIVRKADAATWLAESGAIE